MASQSPQIGESRSTPSVIQGMARLVAGALCLGLLSTSGGCVFSHGPIEHEEWTGEIAVLQNAYPAVEKRVSFTRRSKMINPEGFKLVTEVLSEGPIPVQSGRQASPSDFVMEVDAAQRSKLGFWGAMSMITLLAIPGYVDYETDLSVDVLDRERRLIKRYQRTSTYTTWIGWVFLLWGPFVGDLAAESNAIVDSARDIVREMYVEDYELFRDHGSTDPS